MRISDHLDIPDRELEFTTSRSSGPGGQNVNKVNTRVTLVWDLAGSPSVSDEQRSLIRERLASRVNREGVLQVSSQKHRTQLANREAAVGRFAALITEAISEELPRVPTSVPAASDRRRLQGKRRRSRLKRERSADYDLDE